MASTKDVQICSLCKSHLQGRKEARFPNPSGKTTIVNLDEKGEALCRLCENNVCNKMFYTSLCQEIQRLKREKKNIGERRELEELEQELSKLSVQPVPLKKRQVSRELSQMEKQLEEEEEFKRLERQAEIEVKRQVKSPKKEKKGLKEKLKKLFQ
jgi:hypothetical protein